MRRRRLVVIVVALLVGAAAGIAIWRPWHRPPPPPAGDVGTPLVQNPGGSPDPDASVTLTVTKKSGGPCQVTVTGGSGNMRNSMSADLAAGEARTPLMRFAGTYAIEAVTVTRDGVPPRRHEMNLTLQFGQPYELQVKADDSVEVVPVSR